MSKNFPIIFTDRPVGTVSMSEEGLYYRLTCQCLRPDDKLYCICFDAGDGFQKLGVCVPYINGLHLEKKIPKRQLTKEEVQFRLQTIHNDGAERFIPISPDREVPCLQELAEARFCIRDGQAGISLPG